MAVLLEVETVSRETRPCEIFGLKQATPAIVHMEAKHLFGKRGGVLCPCALCATMSRPGRLSRSAGSCNRYPVAASVGQRHASARLCMRHSLTHVRGDMSAAARRGRLPIAHGSDSTVPFPSAVVYIFW